MKLSYNQNLHNNLKYKWYVPFVDQFIVAASMVPFSFLNFLQRKMKKLDKAQHFLQCVFTYKYYRLVCRYCKKSGALFYFVEAPELSKIRGLTEEQLNILEKKINTSELLDNISYLEKAYCGNQRCFDFAKDRFRGTKLYYNGRYVKPADHIGKYYNVINGIRYTPASKGNTKYKIRLFGSCIVRGYGVADEYTIPNILQEILNTQDSKVIDVINQGTGGATGYDGILNDLKYILDTKIETSEIIVFLTYHTFLERLIKKHQGAFFFECSELFSDQKVKEWWFLNSVVHLNQIGNRVIAEALYKEMKPILDNQFKKAEQTTIVAQEKSDMLLDKELSSELKLNLEQYIAYLFSIKAKALEGKTGAIVMNCNPFTLGHQYLVEQASREVDQLYIFVVEEDRSYFRFEDRLEMVKRGVAKLSNVIVIPSGQFIISALTFPEYFQKEENQKIAIDATKDIEIFGEYIAPALGIKVRFAGEEPLDAITDQYNNLMAEELEKYGIEFRCLKRRQLEDGQIISATKVRELLKDGEWEKIKQYVPESTLEFLEKYKTAKI